MRILTLLIQEVCEKGIVCILLSGFNTVKLKVPNFNKENLASELMQ